MKPSFLLAAGLALVSVVLSSPAHADPAPGAVRIEETDPAIVYSPGWIYDTAYGTWSGGSAKYTVDAAAHATFNFTGTGVSWIGYRGRYGGIVTVFLDGALVSALDTYSPTEQLAVPVYTVTGLPPGNHSLTVKLTGARNPFAVNSETAVDAFDVFR